MKRKPKTIDEYLATLPSPRAAVLEDLRQTIRSIIPQAEECISYGIPAFRLEENVLAGFCARAQGYSYFPFSGRTLSTLSQELARYQQTKGSLHFDADDMLPAPLVRKLIKARRAEVETALQRR